MRRLATLGVMIGATLSVAPTAARHADGAAVHAPVTTKELVVVYFGTSGTDRGPDYQESIRTMKTSLARTAAAAKMTLVTRGVSMDPGVEEGMRHLATLGPFDEVSLGGNWTNSEVVRYLGPSLSGDHLNARIPQVVVLERSVTRDGSQKLDIGPERELGRFIGAGDIPEWVARGTPIPKP